MIVRTALSLTLAASLITSSLVACGDDDGADPGGDALGDALDDDGVTFDPWAAPEETDGFQVLWNYRDRSPTSSESDLWIMEADGSLKRSISEIGKLATADDEPLACTYGCFISPDLRWIAIATGPPGVEGGFELALGALAPNLEVSIFKGYRLQNVIDFKFAGDRMFFSRPAGCVGPSCRYDFSVVELSESVNEQIPFLTFPPENVLGDSTYRGRFKVSRDGRNLVMLQTTIRSVAVYLWRDGTGLVQLDFICKYGTQGDCQGTGSEYSDLDPVGFSPDSRWIVFFTFSDRWQRARIYDTQNPDNVQVAILASVPSGVYIERVCEAGMLEDWQWQRVVGDPIFTPDGEEIIFLGENTCRVDGQPQTKAHTNLYRVKLATLLSGKTLEEEDVFSITANPRGDVTANKRTTGFSLSPDGATVVFAATPTFEQNGVTVIGDGTARQRNDREIYRVRLDGTNLQQISNDIAWSAESPTVVVPRN